MNKTADDNLAKAQYFGGLFGCAVAYFILRYHVPEFNSRFLVVKQKMVSDDSALSLVSSPLKRKYCDMVAYFQLWVGIYMFFLCLITLVNTALRFVEISESDRGQFSNE